MRLFPTGRSARLFLLTAFSIRTLCGVGVAFTQELTIGQWTFTETTITSTGDVQECRTNAANPTFLPDGSPRLQAEARVDPAFIGDSKCEILLKATTTINVGPGKTELRIHANLFGHWLLEDAGGEVKVFGEVFVDNVPIASCSPTPPNLRIPTTPEELVASAVRQGVCLAPGNHSVRAELFVSAFTPSTMLANPVFKSDFFTNQKGMVVRLAASSADEWVEIPVRVFVQKSGTGQKVAVSRDDAAAVVDKANTLLEQSKIRLEFDKRRQYFDDFDDRGNQDLQLENLGEVDAAFQFGMRNLSGPKALGGLDGKGYALIFTNNIDQAILPLAGAGVTAQQILVGLTNHEPIIGTSLIRKGADDPIRTVEEMGRTVAHEFGHLVTLGKFHAIEPDTFATRFGHHGLNESNVMFPSPTAGATRFTPCQIQEMNYDFSARSRGTVKKRAAGQSLSVETTSSSPIRQAAWYDSLGDATPAVIDLRYGDLVASDPYGMLAIRIALRDTLSSVDSVGGTIEVGFDTDHSTGTGSVLGGLAGVDKIVRVVLSGTHPFQSQAGTAVVSLVDGAGSLVTDLLPATTARVLEFADLDALETADSRPVCDRFDLEVDMIDMGFSASAVPYVLRAWSEGSPDVDEVEPGVLVLAPTNPPTVVITPSSASSGDLILLTGSGFSPNAPVTILLGADSIASIPADGFGEFSQHVGVPNRPTASYFVTARDTANGVFDFDVLDLLNSPAVPGAQVWALIVLLGALMGAGAIVMRRLRVPPTR